MNTKRKDHERLDWLQDNFFKGKPAQWMKDAWDSHDLRYAIDKDMDREEKLNEEVDKITLSFEKSAAPFMLETFESLEKVCGFCNIEVTPENLGGVVRLGQDSKFICNNLPCLTQYATHGGK
jgi:hypothetical protein